MRDALSLAPDDSFVVAAGLSFGRRLYHLHFASSRLPLFLSLCLLASLPHSPSSRSGVTCLLFLKGRKCTAPLMTNYSARKSARDLFERILSYLPPKKRQQLSSNSRATARTLLWQIARASEREREERERASRWSFNSPGPPKKLVPKARDEFVKSRSKKPIYEAKLFVIFNLKMTQRQARLSPLMGFLAVSQPW